MELEQAKEILQYLKEEYIKETKTRKFYNVSIHIDEEDIEAIDVILKELDKKDKVIDEMAEDIYSFQIECNRYIKDKEYAKQYFYKKVEGQE